jgi:lauroyl/myristoyl acyltransferase
MRSIFAESILGYLKLVLLKMIVSLRYISLKNRYRCTDMLSLCAYHLLRSKRKCVIHNLSIIGKHACRDSGPAQVFRDYGRYWAELVNINQLWESSRHIIHGPDFPPKETCFVGITFHIGNFELFGKALFENNHQALSVVAERLKPDALAAYFVKIRSRHHIVTIAHDNVRGILEILNKGKPLGILCDRVIEGKGTRTVLFGKQTSLPLSIVKYAHSRNIPIYTAYCIRGHGIIELYCKKISQRQQIESVYAHITTFLEDAIRRNPCQWHNLSAL